VRGRDHLVRADQGTAAELEPGLVDEVHGEPVALDAHPRAADDVRRRIRPGHGRAGEEKHGGDNSGEPHGYTERGFRAMCIS
jgi:hypothetical protein